MTGARCCKQIDYSGAAAAPLAAGLTAFRQHSRQCCWCHSMVWPRRTCHTTANLLPVLAGTDFVFGRQTLTPVRFHAWERNLVREVSRCLVLDCGTVFHLTCMNQTLNCLVSDGCWRTICLRLQLQRLVSSCFLRAMHKSNSIQRLPVCPWTGQAPVYLQRHHLQWTTFLS